MDLIQFFCLQNMKHVMGKNTQLLTIGKHNFLESYVNHIHLLNNGIALLVPLIIIKR